MNTNLKTSQKQDGKHQAMESTRPRPLCYLFHFKVHLGNAYLAEILTMPYSSIVGGEFLIPMYLWALTYKEGIGEIDGNIGHFWISTISLNIIKVQSTSGKIHRLLNFHTLNTLMKPAQSPGNKHRVHFGRPHLLFPVTTLHPQPLSWILISEINFENIFWF